MNTVLYQRTRINLMNKHIRQFLYKCSRLYILYVRECLWQYEVRWCLKLEWKIMECIPLARFYQSGKMIIRVIRKSVCKTVISVCFCEKRQFWQWKGNHRLFFPPFTQNTSIWANTLFAKTMDPVKNLGASIWTPLSMCILIEREVFFGKNSHNFLSA